MKKSGVNVFVAGQVAGTIFRSELEDDLFLFSYRSACPAQGAVSMTMPVVPDPYDSRQSVHPIFEMNLPEGLLRKKLELMFSRVVKHFDSLSLLEIVGKSQIGRLRFASGDRLSCNVPVQSVKNLLTYRGGEDLFEDLLNRFATSSGISGVQPKVLIRDDGRELDRVTDKGATHIVKSFNPAEFPELAANEFFSMQAARYAGLPTARVRLSKNRQLLVVERFDRQAGGKYLGFEDFCVLSGMRADARYHSSYEKLARRMIQAVSPEHQAEARHCFFGTLVLACCIRNGDAHLKNFGVLYDAPGENVRLAPVYDMISTTPYFPRDFLALEFDGRKQFPTRKQVVRFGRRVCDLSQQRVEEICGKVVSGVARAIRDMQRFAGKNPGFQKMADRLALIFTKGLEVFSTAD
jgi:serine/threonine-protein kinase HipA